MNMLHPRVRNSAAKHHFPIKPIYICHRAKVLPPLGSASALPDLYGQGQTADYKPIGAVASGYLRKNRHATKHLIMPLL